MTTTDQPLGELVEAAQRVQKRSISPYSDFAVGCAMRTATGEIHVGCNIENVSFGLTNCAEQVAIGSLVSCGADLADVTEVLVVGPELVDCSPCGACRQVLGELVPQAILWFRNDGDWLRVAVADMLPYAFEASLQRVDSGS